MQYREKIRQAYLEAMEIQTWFPRKSLINAQPARLFEGRSQTTCISAIDANTKPETVTTSPVTISKQNTPVKRLSSHDILKNSYTPEPVVSITPEPTQPASNISPEGSANSKFRLAIIPLEPDSLVVAEIPYIGLSQFTHYHHRLLQDLSKTLMLPLPSDPQFVREFTWPLTKIATPRGLFGQMIQNDHQAADAVKAYLTNQFGLPRRKIILLLGQAAARFVFDIELPFDKLRGIHPQENNKQIIAISHGLNELMKIPGLKPEAWHDLQALRHVHDDK
ncbi:MAG: hypothetical protein QS721_10690 [Candidatus Endonucleobacter sp. (ex Gigantidas childressi)]|nr:hypothetical protein [Candidatus Endonucleobacter sp. (ex Gigantidas childressi)]